MSVPQEVKLFCRRLQIKSLKTTISVCRTSQKPSLKLFRQGDDHLGDEASVSVNLSLQQDAHKNIFKLDTGAQGNTFPLRFYREMCPQNLARRGQTTPEIFGRWFGPCVQMIMISNLVPYYTQILPSLSTAAHRSRIAVPSVSFYLCHRNSRPSHHRSPVFHRLEDFHMQLYYSRKRDHTLHRYSLQEVTQEKDKQCVISQYPECFNAVERFQGEYHIVIEPSLTPILDPTRRVTISLKDDIKKELDKKCHYSEDRKK